MDSIARKNQLLFDRFAFRSRRRRCKNTNLFPNEKFLWKKKNNEKKTNNIIVRCICMKIKWCVKNQCSIFIDFLRSQIARTRIHWFDSVNIGPCATTAEKNESGTRCWKAHRTPSRMTPRSEMLQLKWQIVSLIGSERTERRKKRKSTLLGDAIHKAATKLCIYFGKQK